MKLYLKRILFAVISVQMAMVASFELFAQNVTVTGTVKDAATNELLVGATVMVKGTTNGVSTDINGHYSIKAKAEDVLVCSIIGYKSVESKVGSKAVVDYALQPDNQLLDATVVVGYGTLKKTQLVGSVENLDGGVIENRPNANVTRSLQGQVAGLNIVQTDGKATHSGSLYIRGNGTSYNTRKNFSSSAAGKTHSIGSQGSALVLIDGVEGSLSQVNPADIETIAVLKDASSAAIYGARAAYGVILVTTKNAETDKVTVTYNGSFSLNSRIVKWEDNIVTDGLEWTEAFYEFYQNDARVPGSSGKIPTTMNTNDISMKDITYLESFRALRESGYDSVYGGVGGKGQYLYYGSYNWLDHIYKDYTTSTTHDISLRGASKKLTYNLTGRYFSQGGIYKIGEEKYNTFNIRAKAKVQVNKWLSVDNNTSVFRSKSNQPMFSTGSLIGHQIDQHGQPVFVPYNEDGTWTLSGVKTGYASFFEGNTGQDDSNLIVGTTFGVTVGIIPEVLKIRGDFSYKATRRWRERYRAPLSFYTKPGVPTEYVAQAGSYKSRWTYDTDYISSNAVLTWTPKLTENHKLNVVAGWNLEDSRYNRFYMQRLGMLFPEKYQSFEMFDGEIKTEQNNSDYGIIGFFGRANYTLLNRYIFEASARYDGSSKFPSGSQWGLFPSFSIGWRLSEEPWMKWADSWMDNFKIRANYGSLGNGTVSPYSYLETMDINKSTVIFDGGFVNYTTNPSVVPKTLTWETVTTYDVGLDFDLLKSRLSFSGDWYRRNTTDLITIGPELPQVYGASAPKGNYASLKTTGWELTLSWRDSFKLAGKDFTYGIKGSVWDTRTWVKEFTSTSGDILDYYSGKELGEIWGFRTDGIFRDNAEANAWATDSYHKNGSNFRAYAGDLKFLDLNGDGKIDYGKGTLDDHGDLDRIGDITPRYQYGVNLDFKWNGIGLSMFFQGVGKRDWYPMVETAYFWGQYNRPYCGYLMKTQTGDNYAQIDYSTENWTVVNYDKNPYWSRRVGYCANRNVGPLTVENDHYLQNASYIRLKNLTVDYSFPKKLVNKIGMQGARIYCSMENLWTWSPMFKHTDMFDPEGIGVGDSDFDSTSKIGLSGVGDGMSYPMLRTFTFGLSLTF